MNQRQMVAALLFDFAKRAMEESRKKQALADTFTLRAAEVVLKTLG